MVWLLGVMVILLGLNSHTCGPSGWTAVWISAAVLWCGVGCIVTLTSLVKQALSRARDGALEKLTGKVSTPPAPRKDD